MRRRTEDDEGRAANAARFRRVWLQYLPVDMDQEELQAITGYYGTVVDFMLFKKRGCSVAWVEYETQRQANEAVEELDERDIEGWNMLIKAIRL